MQQGHSKLIILGSGSVWVTVPRYMPQATLQPYLPSGDYFGRFRLYGSLKCGKIS